MPISEIVRCMCLYTIGVCPFFQNLIRFTYWQSTYMLGNRVDGKFEIDLNYFH